jgi:hypothetical protein
MFKNKLFILLFFVTTLNSFFARDCIPGLTPEETYYLLTQHSTEAEWITSFAESRSSLKRAFMEQAASYKPDTVNNSLNAMGCYGMELLSKIKTSEQLTAAQFFEKNKTSYPILANIFEKQSKKCLEQTKTKEAFDECVKEFNAKQKNQNARDVIWPAPDKTIKKLTLWEFLSKKTPPEPIDLFYFCY